MALTSLLLCLLPITANAAELADTEGGDSGINFVTIILVSLVIALIVAFIRNSSLKGELISVKNKEQAADYIVPGSMKLNTSLDTFLYKEVNRTLREDNNGGNGPANRPGNPGPRPR